MQKLKGIRIKDGLENYPHTLGVTLEDMLSVISDIGARFRWAFLELDSGYKLDVDALPDYHKLAHMINEPAAGMGLHWNELVHIASSLDNSIMIVVAAYADESRRPVLGEKHTWTSFVDQCDVVLNLHDGSWWDIYAKDEKIKERFGKAFRETSRFTEIENPITRDIFPYDVEYE
jgi:hypothetical protein